MTLPHQPFVISLSKLREINTKQVIGQVLNGCIEKWDLQPSNQRKKINQKALGLIRVLFFTFFGGRGGIRTHEAFRPEDFKSSVYTIPPSGQNAQTSCARAASNFLYS